jgi:hypothetical protein
MFSCVEGSSEMNRNQSPINSASVMQHNQSEMSPSSNGVASASINDGSKQGGGLEFSRNTEQIINKVLASSDLNPSDPAKPYVYLTPAQEE